MDNIKINFTVIEIGMSTGFNWLNIDSFRKHHSVGKAMLFSTLSHMSIYTLWSHTPAPGYGRNVTDF
jgi:hypothetical protein